MLGSVPAWLQSPLTGQIASSCESAGQGSGRADGRKLSRLQEIKGETLEHLASAQDGDRRSSGQAHAF